MKKLNLFLVLLAVSSLAFAQSKLAMNEVPKAVVQSHLSQNSYGSTHTNWSTDSNDIFKVKYLDEGNLWESQFRANGSWVRTFRVISYDEVMAKIQSQVTSSYPSAQVESSRIELNNEGKFCIVELNEAKQCRTLYFTTSSLFYK